MLLCSTLNTSDWASAMRLVRLQKHRQDPSLMSEQLLLNKIRMERIQRYQAMQKQINTAFADGLCELQRDDHGDRLNVMMPAP